MRRTFAIALLLVPAFALAAFQGSNPQKKITSSTASASDTLREGGSQVLLTVTGGSSLTGAFVTFSATFPCTAKRDTASAANASFFVIKGVPVVRARPFTGRGCVAMTTSDTGQTATLRLETGSGAP